MSLKKYGKIHLEGQTWIIPELEPHVAIKLKNIFLKVSKGTGLPYRFANNPENATDLSWFMSRYPLDITHADLTELKEKEEDYFATQIEMERILTPNYKPKTYTLKPGQTLRHYQSQAVEAWKINRSLLIGDDVGLGKTYEAIGGLLDPETRPAIVVVMTHLQEQWAEKITAFSHLTPHKIRGTKPYDLPEADIYIIRYSCLAGWIPVFQTGFFNSVVYDEVQELRVCGTPLSAKVSAARILTHNAKYALGLSATPIWNYGDEIFNVLQVLKPDCLGSRHDFMREWTNSSYGVRKPVVTDTKALGSHLRENHLLLRRTRRDVGQYLPPVNTIIHTVEYDEKAVRETKEIARILAVKVTSSKSFVERGQAARELDIMVRQTTGISKAKYVARFAKMIIDGGEPVVLAGWHRAVYDIWNDELGKYKPVMYTGSETPRQKEQSVEDFMSGKTDCLIISLRSGIGLDRLQHRCKVVIIGELDWSPKVHEQLIGRVDREGQKDRVTVFYLVSESGSDPLIIDMLGVKSSQSRGIMDPLLGVDRQYTDESRIKLLAEQYLKKSKKTLKN